MASRDDIDESTRFLQRQRERQTSEADLLETSARVYRGLRNRDEEDVRRALGAPPAGATGDDSRPAAARGKSFRELLDSLRTVIDSASFLDPELSDRCLEQLDSIDASEPGTASRALCGMDRELRFGLIEALPNYHDDTYEWHRRKIESRLERLTLALEELQSRTET